MKDNHLWIKQGTVGIVRSIGREHVELTFGHNTLYIFDLNLIEPIHDLSLDTYQIYALQEEYCWTLKLFTEATHSDCLDMPMTKDSKKEFDAGNYKYLSGILAAAQALKFDIWKSQIFRDRVVELAPYQPNLGGCQQIKQC